jgi:hypothetical protein
MTTLGFFRPRKPLLLLTGLLLIAGYAPSPADAQVAAKALKAPPAALTSPSGTAASQEGPIRGPMLGYVFDPTSLGLRPLLGIPGASYVGNALPIGFTPSLVEVSPSHGYALGIEAASGDLFLIDLRPDPPTTERLTTVSAGVDRIFYSPLGKAVALYYRQPKQVEILTGLPGEVSRTGRVGLAGMPGVLTALAVSDDGKTLAAAASQGDGGALYAGSPGEDLQLVGPLGRAPALSFLNDSQDLLVADLGRDEVVRIRNIKSGAEWTVLASREDGLDQPVAVSASRDNTTAFAVNAADHRIAWMPLSGGPVEFLDCPCKPAGLSALTAGSVFRLTAASSAPMYMLDARPQGDGLASRPRVLFIPALDRAPTGRDDTARSPLGRVRR